MRPVSKPYVSSCKYHLKHMFFSPDTSLEKHFGSPRSRQGAKATAHPGENTEMLSHMSVRVHWWFWHVYMCVCFQVLRTVSQAWANPSAVKHTPIEQQLYVSKALLLSVSLLKDSELHELRSGTNNNVWSKLKWLLLHISWIMHSVPHCDLF